MEGMDVAKHPTRHRLAPTTKNDPAHDVITARLGTRHAPTAAKKKSQDGETNLCKG